MAHVLARRFPAGSPLSRLIDVVTEVHQRFGQPVPRRYTRLIGDGDVMATLAHIVTEVHGVWRVPAASIASYRASQGCLPVKGCVDDHLLVLVESHPLMTPRRCRDESTRLQELVMDPKGEWSLVRLYQ